MWQRVQTLYLFLATALIAALFFCHKAGDVFYTDYWPYLVLLLVLADRDDYHLQWSKTWRKNKSVVIRVCHDESTDKTSGNAP